MDSASMISTRKLVRNTTKKGAKTARGEYLLPQLSGVNPSGFLGIRTGRTYEQGYVVYMGRDITAEALWTEFIDYNDPPKDRDIAFDRLSAFVQALQQCKVGNLLSISYTPDGLPVIKVEQEFLLREPDKRLP
jgi:hypothetical protein